MMIDRAGRERSRRSTPYHGFAGGGELGSGGALKSAPAAPNPRPTARGGADGRDPFDSLLVLEMPPVGGSSLDHSLRVIETFGNATRSNAERSAVKLRLHAASMGHRVGAPITERNLLLSRLRVLTEATRHAGMNTIATPSDERTLDLCLSLNIDVIKVAGADFGDGPLIDAITSARRPTILSADGAALEDVEALVCDFKAKDFSLVFDHWISVRADAGLRGRPDAVAFFGHRRPRLTIRFSPRRLGTQSLA